MERRQSCLREKEGELGGKEGERREERGPVLGSNFHQTRYFYECFGNYS